MATTTSNLVLGAANLYVANTGVSETGLMTLASLSSAPTGASWRDLGSTSTDGVTLTVNQEYTELEVDQVVDIPGQRLTKRAFTIEANLAELTLENLQTALNGGTLTTGTGTKTYDPIALASTAEPSYVAMIIDGIAPSGKPRRILVRKALSNADIQFAYSKGNQSFYSVTWVAHFVSPTVGPFSITDAT